jgi:DNA end-binding protein Ku
MARPIAGATISFGLVSIPVRLYPATQSKAGVSFNLLHKKCGTRLKQQYVCPRDHEVVGRDDMVKGYEFSKDQYVTFTPAELKSLEEKATQSIDIVSFVPVAAIDPVYFERPYYLGPEKGGDKAYSLLTEAMRDTGRAALARYAARGKQYLVMLRPSGDGRGLVLQELLYADEVRSISDVPLPDTHVREPELKLAKQLIDQITTDTFDPTQFHDEVRERIHSDIEKKVKGQDISESEPAQAEPARIIDLMAALKASLGKGAANSGAKSGAKPAADSGDEPSAEHRDTPRRAAHRSEEAAGEQHHADHHPKRARRR